MAFNLNIERKESINKCVRFPVKMLNDIEKIASQNNVSFSKFVILACEYALEDMENQKNNKKVK